MTTDNDTRWVGYLKTVLACRDNSAFAGQRADLARGLSDATKHRAMPYVYNHAPENWGTSALEGYRYALALAATHRNVPHVDKKKGKGDSKSNLTFGRSMASLTHTMTGAWPQVEPKHRDGVARKVVLLPECDLDTAAAYISSLLALAATPKYRTPVNFIDLAYLLIFWGNGYSDASQERRQRIVRDYYRPRTSA